MTFLQNPDSLIHTAPIPTQLRLSQALTTERAERRQGEKKMLLQRDRSAEPRVKERGFRANRGRKAKQRQM